MIEQIIRDYLLTVLTVPVVTERMQNPPSRYCIIERTSENCANYLRKGSLVFIEGKLTTRKYQDKEGIERQVTEIKADRVQFLDSKNINGGNESQQRLQQQQRKREAPTAADRYEDNSDCPF